jgi:proteasome lid subunit RPN8/RPN11
MFNPFDRKTLEKGLKEQHDIDAVTVQLIYDLAKKSHPNEITGSILKNGGVQVSRPGSLSHCVVSAEVLASGSTEILCLWHSHCGIEARFSKADIETLRASGYSAIVINSATDTFDYADKEDRLKFPLEGRNWYYGIHDCYSAVVNYLKREFPDVELPDIPRGKELEWRSNSFAPFEFLNQHEKWRLYPTVAPQKGDILLSNKGRHLGVFINDYQYITHYYDRPCEIRLFDWNSLRDFQFYRYLPGDI